MSGTEIERHLNDAELMGLIDGQAEDGEARRWHQHLERCALCTDAVATLRARSRLVSQRLDDALFRSPPLRWEDVKEAAGRPSPAGRADGLHMPSLRTAAPWLRAAAILVLLAAPLAALPSVRAWVAERVTGPQETAADPIAPARSDRVDPAASVVRFTPEVGEFTVRAAESVEGILLLGRSDGPQAVLRAPGSSDPVVSASMLELRSAAPGRYQLELPEFVTGVRVVMGGRTRTVTAADLDRGMEISLER